MIEIRGIPLVAVSAGGRQLNAPELAALIEVRVVQALAVPAQCELVFRDPPGPLPDRDRLQIGMQLEVDVPGNASIPLFAGQITAVEHVYTARNEHEIYVRCYDALQQLRREQRTRALSNLAFDRIVKQLAADAGVGTTLPHGLPATPPWKIVFQHQQTNLELLNELCGPVGWYPVVHGRTLTLVSLRGAGASVRLVRGENLNAAHVEFNASQYVPAVETLGWDPLLGDEQRPERVSRARVGISSGLLNQASRLSAAPRTLVNESSASGQDSRALAQAELDYRTATTAVFRGEVDGNPALRPGTPIDVSGLDSAHDGTFVVTSAVHRLDGQSGYVTEVATDPPPPPRRPRSDVVTLGEVTAVDDPEQHGRVRVRLPAYGNPETDWMQVLAPGGGQGKGIINTPDVDDLVLVLLVRENPGLGLVLGGLMGNKQVYDSGVHNGRVRRTTWRTPGGLSVQLDDVANRIRIGVQGGGYIEIDGNQIAIVASAIDFRRG